MPGMVGFISKMPRHLAEPRLLRMLEAVRHECFYRTGTWIDESLGVYVGWTALEGSFSEGMPLYSERGDVVVVFSGKEYPDHGTRAGLASRGHSLDSVESGYLVHLYEEDPSCIRNLNGMFHGLIADRGRGEVILFNDRYGMHRLCYHESKDAFYFATEAKALLTVCPELRVGDPQGLGDFVACSCVLENRTIFKDIYVMPAASEWCFRNASLERRNTYFDPCRWEGQSPLDAENYYRALRNCLVSVLPKYFSGNERTGMAMTGGLDTRVILACHPVSPGALPAYTFGGMHRESRDVRIGRQVARICRQPYQVIEVGKEFLKGFAGYAERSIYLTEGTIDVSRASDLYVSAKVRDIAPAKIVGTYGSEILRHAVMFKPVSPEPGLFAADLLPYVSTAANTYTGLRRQHPVTFAAFRQSPWYHHGVLALEQSQLSVRSPYLDNDFVRTVYRAPHESLGTEDVRLRLIRDGSSVLSRFRSDRGVGGNGGGLTSALAHAFQEFTFKAEYAYDYGMPQWLAQVDHTVSWLHLERLFLGRHKLLYFRTWYRDALAGYVQEMLLDPRTLSRSYLEAKKVRALVDKHIKHGLNYTTEIHKLLSLELLHRLFLDAR